MKIYYIHGFRDEVSPQVFGSMKAVEEYLIERVKKGTFIRFKEISATIFNTLEVSIDDAVIAWVITLQIGTNPDPLNNLALRILVKDAIAVDIANDIITRGV